MKTTRRHGRGYPRFTMLDENLAVPFETTVFEHRAYICQHGDDMPEVRDWRWRS